MKIAGVHLIKSVCIDHNSISFVLIVVMAGDKIRIFSSVQKFYQMMGISPLNKNSLKNTFLVISLIQLCSSTGCFILFEAKSIDEFGFAFYVFITTLTQLGHLLINTNKIRKITELIESYEAFIEKSK